MESKIVDDPPKILRIICQRPFFTGSGVNLIELIKQTKKAGFEQFIIFGHPIGEPYPLNKIIDPKFTLPVYFDNEMTSEKGEINFPVAGMSDRMPYDSTRFSEFDEKMLETYLSVFARKINKAIKIFDPNIIHSHHLWLITALCRVLHPKLPILGTCHNTALRQLVLANQLRNFTKPIKYLNAISVLNDNQKQLVKKAFNFKNLEVENKFYVVGTGFNTDIFYHLKQQKKSLHKKIIYVGKLSKAKGVPELIKAIQELLKESNLDFELLLAGSGAGEEKDQILELSKGHKNKIRFLGQLNQQALAKYFRECELFILPSYFEGLPSVLIESLACGCNAIVTDLPGIKETITSTCGEFDQISYLPLPKMNSIDQPFEEDIEFFIKKIKEAIQYQLNQEKLANANPIIPEKIKSNFSWKAIFEKYLEIYTKLLKY
ncbi:MAG: glycosyltransferase [Candidatus Lokiarchaeota archaeon]|nr:glycosyltransferase [Candidatus Lokiarchaeota archaeon]